MRLFLAATDKLRLQPIEDDSNIMAAFVAADGSTPFHAEGEAERANHHHWIRAIEIVIARCNRHAEHRQGPGTAVWFAEELRYMLSRDMQPLCIPHERIFGGTHWVLHTFISRAYMHGD